MNLFNRKLPLPQFLKPTGKQQRKVGWNPAPRTSERQTLAASLHNILHLGAFVLANFDLNGVRILNAPAKLQKLLAHFNDGSVAELPTSSLILTHFEFR